MPTARADAAATPANTAVRIDVLANDGGKRLRVVGVTALANGTAALNADQTITYTPKPLFTGSDRFSYTVRDGGGARATASVTVTVRNRAPVAGADSAATDSGVPVAIAVLANDNDPDGHPLAVTGASAPANGTAVVDAGGTITFTPRAGFTGTDGFTYALSDGRGGTAQGTVSVTARNRPPVAADDGAATDAGTPVAIPVLANDHDPDGHPLAITAVSPPAHGAAVANPDGTISYAPAAGYSGRDGFTYTVSDGRGGTATAVVTVEVRGAPAGEPFSDGTLFTDGFGWTPAAAA